ncbi:hypothetical protein IW140_001873 [Coemansia sp. RSA 1813]|nr:hypothetical protein IW138_002070 [Coemansia sp. RSA 986]KAJ2571170.1 hypothetical protein IW140_001873 [Coemansia sp. RSA 1813]
MPGQMLPNVDATVLSSVDLPTVTSKSDHMFVPVYADENISVEMLGRISEEATAPVASMDSVSIISLSGFPYQTNGFQSLSGRHALQLRSGPSLRQPRAANYLPPRWCPTLDILAVPEGRALRLVRLSGGETIWRRTLQDSNQTTASKAFTATSVSEKTASDSGKETQAVIRAIAWNPSGQSIAVLYSDGNLVQRDAAHGDIVHESNIELADDELVASMVWVSCDGDSETLTGILTDESSMAVKPLPLEFNLPALSPLDKSKATPSNINSEPDNLTAIIITTTRGAVWVTLGGIFTLPVSKLPYFEKDSNSPFTDFVVTNAQISCDLSTLCIYLTRKQDKQHSDCPNAALCTLDTSMLSAATPLLRSLVYLSARISGLFLYIENTIDLVINEATARGEVTSRARLLQMFEGILQDHGVDEVTSPEAELCRLAVTGRASEPTSQFLLAKLKSTKLKSWENSGRQGAVAIARLIYQYVSPAIERAILAVSRFLQIVTADFSQLSLSGYSFGGNGEGCSAPLSEIAEARSLILRAIVLLGWMYGRFEEYAGRLQEEQRENQVFVDWALLAVDDLNWQNEGIRKAGNDDTMDDGLRPIRPEIDYKLLLRFVRSAFRRRSADDALDEQIKTQNILSLKDDRNKADSKVVQVYFDILSEKSHTESIQKFKLGELDRKQGSKGFEEREGVFEFPFHSADLLDEATRRCTDSTHNMNEEKMSCGEIPPPTCREALTAAKGFISQALAWPSAVLGNGLQWNIQSDFVYFSRAMYVDGAGGDNDYVKSVGRISDMHCIASATNNSMHDQSNDAGTLYLAAVSTRSHVLEVLAVSRLLSREETKVALIKLAVKTCCAKNDRSEMELLSLKPAAQSLEETRPVQVTDISFFDDDLLGITFTIDGCDSSYLGTISYRQGNSRITYHPVSKCDLDDNKGQKPEDVTPVPLEFAKLLKLDEEARYPVSLSTNGRQGRRSIAVVERRGKFWWPYDMDNSEDEDDE